MKENTRARNSKRESSLFSFCETSFFSFLFSLTFVVVVPLERERKEREGFLSLSFYLLPDDETPPTTAAPSSYFSRTQGSRPLSQR